jgi:DNA-binding response OmpR family regulator
MNQIEAREEVQARNILIVDDDTDTCTLLDTLFRANGYATKIVYSGQEAVEYMDAGQPDAVVLDLMMPEMDGWETFTQMRSKHDIPVLFLTALDSGDYAAQALNFAHDDYMRKPYSNRELLARIANLMNSAMPKHTRLNLTTRQNRLINMAITVVIPAYNESRFIGSTVLKASSYANTVIVVDDGSCDNTAEIAEAAGAVLVRHKCNKGKGAALNTGFCKARELGAQVVVTMDADGQHLPEELSQVVRPVLAGEADIVIGSRYLVHHSGVPRSRIWGHWFFNKLTRLASGAASTDSQSGYRAFSHTAVEAICFCSTGFAVESEMQFIAHENGLRLKEVPITILYTDKPKRSVIGQGLSVLGGVFKLMGQYRPLFYFGLPGFIIMLLGIIWGFRVVGRYEEVHQLAIGNALISILLFIIGMILFSTGFTLHSIRGLLIDMLRLKYKDRM